MKEEKDIAPMDFAEYLKNQALQRTEKFIKMESTVILVKVDEMYSIQESLLSVSHWLLVER